MPPANPAPPQAAPTPVFVDDTGRRHRNVRLIGWVLGAVMLAYLALLGISLVGSPGVVPLSLPAIGRLLPGPAAPLIHGPSSVASRPGDVVAGTVSTMGATGAGVGSVSPRSPAQPAQPAAAQPTSAPHTVASPAARPQPRPTAVPTSGTTPTPARTPKGNPSPNGSPRATHAPSSHPSPKSTRRSAHGAKSSPTPSPSAT